MINSPGSRKALLNRRNLLAAAGAAGVAQLVPTPADARIQGLVVVGQDNWLFPIWDEVRRMDAKKIPLVGDLFNAGVDVMKKAKIDVAILLTPAKSRIYREMLPADFQFVQGPEQRYQLALDSLRRPGTLVPDMNAVVGALHKAQPKTVLYFKGDTHWNAVAAEAAAVAMAAEIKSKLHLPPSSQHGVQFSGTKIDTQDKNDLADLMPAAERGNYPLETFPIHQVAQSGGAGLLDSDAADVVVIGNSFMQPKFGFSNMLSNQLDRPVGLFWKVHQVGPYQTLLQYFATSSFKQHKPKLIVWDLHETDIVMPSDHRDGWGQNAMKSDEFLAKLHAALGV